MVKTLDEILNELADEPPTMAIDLVERSKAHLPVIILIDTSESMTAVVDMESNISRVNKALREFIGNVSAGSNEAYERIRVHGDFCIIAYGNGGVRVMVPWRHGSELDPNVLPELHGSGETPMYEAILLAGDMMLEMLRAYRHEDQDAFRGAIFNLTDGAPTDLKNREKAIKVVQMFETGSSARKALAEFHHVGVPGFDRQKLEELSIGAERVNALGSTDISAFFQFLQITFSQIAGDIASASELADWRERHLSN